MKISILGLASCWHYRCHAFLLIAVVLLSSGTLSGEERAKKSLLPSVAHVEAIQSPTVAKVNARGRKARSPVVHSPSSPAIRLSAAPRNARHSSMAPDVRRTGFTNAGESTTPVRVIRPVLRRGKRTVSDTFSERPLSAEVKGDGREGKGDGPN